MIDLQKIKKLWENNWIKSIVLLLVLFFLWLIFFKNDAKPLSAVAIDGKDSVVFINPKTGKPIQGHKCDDDSTSSQACEIFSSKFAMEDLHKFTIIRSIRTDNTRCCTTYIFEGQAVEICADVPDDTIQCPPYWKLTP